jgi:uncharacterized 2Fe-2S/4Fe-4S cluster protein (DUF4445 family)
LNADALVVFTPSGRRGRFPLGTSLLAAARALGVDLDSVCGGRGLCGRCQLSVADGVFAKHAITSAADHVSAAGEDEARTVARRRMPAGRRLGCQAFLLGDVVADVPAEAQVHRQVVRKRAEARAIVIDPVVRLAYVEVPEPLLQVAESDLGRLRAALAREWGLSELACDAQALAALQQALRAEGGAVTAAVRQGRNIVAVWPGLVERAYGLAIDVGSTTIAAHLTDLATGAVLAAAGAMNPQIRFGEDLMSRVSYAMLNPGGAAEMTAAVRETVDRLAGDVAAEAGIGLDLIVEAVVVGNPVMHHLYLGLDPTPLGQAPFAPAVDEALTLPARELGLHLNPGAQVYLLPCIAGHVGADAAAVALSEAPHLGDAVTLVVDVGTNAEILLGNRRRLLAASSPTGPAFEGAQISSGQRAAAGAIERVRIDRESYEPRLKVIGSELWSDQPSFADETRLSGVTGICGSGTVEAIAELFLAGLISAEGVIDGSKAALTDRIAADGRTFAFRLFDGPPPILITQTDVRAIQLAKGALYAGARLLMDRLGIETVDRIALAGAFGSHIDPVYAMVLGLIPDCDPAKVSSAGNAAGTGARIALVNAAARAEVEALVKQVEKVETAVEPAFQAHFVEAMALPHRTAPYPHLSKAVALPARPSAAPGDNGRRRRRR